MSELDWATVCSFRESAAWSVLAGVSLVYLKYESQLPDRFSTDTSCPVWSPGSPPVMPPFSFWCAPTVLLFPM